MVVRERRIDWFGLPGELGSYFLLVEVGEDWIVDISNSGAFELAPTFGSESDTSDIAFVFVGEKSPFSVGDFGVDSSFGAGDSIPICVYLSLRAC